MATKRLFIAAPLPEAYKAIILRFQNQQKANFRWVTPENWHLTLLFLGDFPENHLHGLQKCLTDFFASCEPATLKPKTFMLAPNPNKARMVWLRFHETTAYDQLCKGLYKTLQDWYAERSIPFNLKLHKQQIPHVTLARFQTLNARKRLFLNNKTLAENLPDMHIHQALLYESLLKPEGAVYHKLAGFDLAGESPQPL